MCIASSVLYEFSELDSGSVCRGRILGSNLRVPGSDGAGAPRL